MLVCLLFLLAGIQAFAQQQATGRVVDSETGEPIPFATVYVSESKGTLTNEEGRFSIDLEAGETVHVSFMGYKRLQFTAGSVPTTIKLESTATQMREFTVVAPNNILERVIKRLDTEYKTKERKTASFFLRQTFEQENGRSEMVEGFMNSASAINLRKTSIVSARHYRIGDYSEVGNIFDASNLQHLFDFAPRVYETPFWKEVAVPLGYCYTSSSSSSLVGSGGIIANSGTLHLDNHKKVFGHYNTYIEEYTEDGEDFFRIHFTRNEQRYGKGLLVGTLHVQARGYQVLGFEGRMSNVVLDTERDF